MGLLYDQWFCDKITINTPEGDKVLFPCYCWLDCNKKLYLRPAKASLVFQDTNLISQKQRMREIEEQQKLFSEIQLNILPLGGVCTLRAHLKLTTATLPFVCHLKSDSLSQRKPSFTSPQESSK
ncbi:hypothetical protein PO909_030096 [Leuciscus waleckii]